MQELTINCQEGKKIFFASDFHLGVPDIQTSIDRERKIVRWLDSIYAEAEGIFLMGDVFDFWFEYKKAVPKGFIRLLGKLAELADKGIPIYLFTGNHDMWMSGYLSSEMRIQIYNDPVTLLASGKKLLIGHGDGLGPGDPNYKYLKKIFTSKAARWAFRWLHPDIGISLAQRWSRQSRISNIKLEEKFKGEDREFLLSWCREVQQKEHHDYYVFGHRHLPLDLAVDSNSRYFNLGEWVHFSNYAEFDGSELKLKSFN